MEYTAPPMLKITFFIYMKMELEAKGGGGDG